jgi:hypothetical protein
MYRSSTGGDSWEAAGDGIVDVQVHCIAVNRASHVFIGTSGGVFRSTDNGNTWQAAGAGIAVGAVIQALAVNAAGQIYAGTTGSVYVSNDNGSSWNPVLPGITNSDARALAFDNNGYLFAATWGGGVFVSSASTLASPGRVTLLMPAEGAIIRRDTVVFSWHAIDVSVSGYELQLAQDSTFADSSMYASSDTNFTLSSLRFGTYWWRVRALNIYGVGQFSEAREFHLTTTTAASLSDVPEIFRLDQNYPNPFNPETSIRFEVPYRSRVRLQIFNTLGQLVTTLADEVRDAGRYEARWNALNVASGVYLCRMEAGSFVDTRKLLLVR